MFEDIFLEYKLHMQQAEHILESASANFKIKILELSSLRNQGYITEAGELTVLYRSEIDQYTEAVDEYCQNIMDNMKKSTDALINRLDIMVSTKLNKKTMKAAKEELLARRSADALKNNEKITIFDRNKYVTAYNRYVAEYIKYLNAVYAKKYDTPEESRRAIAELDIKLMELADKYKLNNKEVYTLEVSAARAPFSVERDLEDGKTSLRILTSTITNGVSSIEKALNDNPDAEKISSMKRSIRELSSKSIEAGAAIVNGLESELLAVNAMV